MGEISEKCPGDSPKNPFKLSSYVENFISIYRWYFRGIV
jgi:hypothetical protein